jgi:UbiD family decarboxylase
MNPDLRAFLRALEARGETQLVRWGGPASPRFELTALALELERRFGGEGPAVLCERVEGSALPVVTNLLGSRARYALAMGVEVPCIGEEWQRREARAVAPVAAREAPVQEVIWVGEEADLGRLPVLTHFAQDAGPYITSGILVAKDPATGVRNGSFHRCQVKGPRILATSLHSRRHLWQLAEQAETEGRPLEVAIVNGAHPLFYFGCGMWKGPITVDEYEVAGGFFGQPLETVPCKTIALDVPAAAEVVIEGVIPPGEREEEGPFGEFTGYASHTSTRHRIDVTAITMRRDAIWQDIVSGISAEHNGALRIPQEERIFRALKAQHPSVGAVSYPLSGACRFHCYVSMGRGGGGQAKNAIFHAFAEDLSLKLVVVVDEDIDVHNEREVWWAVATRMQADRDLFVVPGVAGAMLDPSSDEGLTAKVGIDATVPRGGWRAERCTLPPGEVERARALADRLLGG